MEPAGEVRRRLELALREVCAEMRAELVVTDRGEKGLGLLRSRGDWALAIADESPEDMPGAEFLRGARVLHPSMVRILLAKQVPDALEEPTIESPYRTFARPVQPAAIAGFAAEALRLHALDRKRFALVRDLGLKAERLERRKKLLDVVVRERTRELEQAMARLQVAGRQAIMGLAAAMEAHDGYDGHGARVAASALELARLWGLSEAELPPLEMAAFLHDIGKVGVRDRVLLKPGPLDEEEWKLVRVHPAVGADIVGKIEMLRDVTDTILHVRERWNGSGYPDGLAGNEIPLRSRILAVADAYDALASARPYRGAMERDACYGEMRTRSGTWFDPQLVDMFVGRRLG